ncbi:MAG: hypothetical protein RLZZ385_851, partial [Pseudomonadota bacterium]
MSDKPDELPLPIPPPEKQLRYFRWFFFGLLAFLLYQLILILSVFADAIIWAASLTLVVWPVFKQVQLRLPGRPGMAAALCTAAVLLLVLVPLVLLFNVVVVQSGLLYPVVEQWLANAANPEQGQATGMLPAFMTDALSALREGLSRVPLLAGLDLNALVLDNVNTISARLADFGAATARSILFGLVNLVLILFLMYFCFRDGQRFIHWCFEIIPMETRHAEAIANRVYQMVTAIIRGALITATVQGTLATIGYLLAGVPLAVFFGVLTGFFALVPLVGAGLVWFPVGLFMMTQSVGWGVFILVWGFFLVSMIDNLLKPILIGNETRMPILLIFCAMLGGASVYGVTGF